MTEFVPGSLLSLCFAKPGALSPSRIRCPKPEQHAFLRDVAKPSHQEPMLHTIQGPGTTSPNTEDLKCRCRGWRALPSTSGWMHRSIWDCICAPHIAQPQVSELKVVSIAFWSRCIYFDLDFQDHSLNIDSGTRDGMGFSVSLPRHVE